MRAQTVWIRTFLQAGFLAGCFLGGAGFGPGEELPPPAAPAPVVVTEPAAPAAKPEPSPAPAGEVLMLPEAATTTPAPDKDGGKGQDPPKSCWLNVPPIMPLPRTGWFFIWPSGPGYYSLKDCCQDNYREEAPKTPWPPFGPDGTFCFFNADFRYLDDPKNTEHDCFDPIKRIHLGDNWLLSLGGEERLRYMHEVDGYARFTGVNQDYTLDRTRLYADLWYKDIFRVYAEYIDAQITGENLVPLAIDRNHSDMLDLFGELKLFELNGHPAYLRVGRQELLYGSQRLISPLDWANTRRTFQGAKVYWHGDKFDLDVFWVQPIIVDVNHFDSPDSAQEFFGTWTTYRPNKSSNIDLYYLYLQNTRVDAPGQFVGLPGYRVSTFGARYVGDYQKHLLWDFEGMYQVGDNFIQNISADAWTTGLGWNFANVPMTPQIWVYNDFASGNHNPGVGAQDGTFNQLFPFGHFYFGFLDFVGRQNIDDLNAQLAFFPTKWITTGIQYHVFRLDAAKDALYNASGTIIRRDPTGRAGTDVGDEIDVFTNFHLSVHQDIFLGWSKLYAGQFIRSTGLPVSPELFYVQWSFKF
jgi:hypothetical protein